MKGRKIMTSWSPERLDEITRTDDFHVSPYREDGVTPGTPVWIWAVVVDDGVYIRAYNGRKSTWYQAAVREGAGIIRAAGRPQEVTFRPVDGDIIDRVDDAFRTKYAGSPYLPAQLGRRLREATLLVMPARTPSPE